MLGHLSFGTSHCLGLKTDHSHVRKWEKPLFFALSKMKLCIPVGSKPSLSHRFQMSSNDNEHEGSVQLITCQAATSTTALPRCWNSWSGSLETTSVGRMVCNSFLDVRKVCVPECFRVAKCYSSLGGWGRSCVQLSPTIMLLIFRLSPFGQAAPLSASQGDESSGSWSQVCIQVVSLWSWWPTGFGWKMRAMFT